LREVREVKRVFAIDARRDAAERFVEFVAAEHGVHATIPPSLRDATLESEIVVTSTPSSRPVLHLGDVAAGTFVAAIGADNEHKQEIAPELLRASVVVVDDLEQCAHIGDLHHAVAALVMQTSAVRASLDQVVVGTRRGRLTEAEVIIFDSTGLAIEDVAAASLVYEQLNP